MDPEEKKGFEAESQHLRLELKKWETSWARDHGGAKPSRDDIKHNGEIAHKYTAYNRLRNLLTGKTHPSSKHHEAKKDTKRDDARRKRKAADTTVQTPSKRHRTAQTPMKASATADIITPSVSRKLFSPVVPTSIGPTPQRDGRVLGLFDILSDAGKDEADDEKRRSMAFTPSKSTGFLETTSIPGTTSFAATPRKQTLGVDDDDNDDSEIGRRLGRTPMSSAKRNLLDRFTQVTTVGGMTSPLRTRNANEQPPAHTQLVTPSKSDGCFQQFATPAFLRRAPALAPVDENGEFMSPPGHLRLPRKPLMRGLSSVLASMRKMEDEQLDDDLDVLHELEMETEGVAPPPRRPNEAGAAATAAPGVQVADSQMPVAPPPPPPPLSPSPSAHSRMPRLLGGFDDEGLYDSPPEEEPLGRDGQPLRVFKKKGQKRTTRLVHMRPTRTKRPAAGTMAEEEDSEDENVVPETQTQAQAHDAADALATADLSGSEFGSDSEAKPTRAKKQQAKKKRKTADKDGAADKASKEGPVKKKLRKVNELAHANFKRLKLRNNGAKGGPGFNSRFRRRR